MGISIYSQDDFKNFLKTNEYDQNKNIFSDIENFLYIKFLDGIENNDVPKEIPYIEIENFWSFSENNLAYNYFLKFLDHNEWIKIHLFDLAENYYEILFPEDNDLMLSEIFNYFEDIEYQLKTILSINNSLNEKFSKSLSLINILQTNIKELVSFNEKNQELIELQESLKKLILQKNSAEISKYRNLIEEIYQIKILLDNNKNLITQNNSHQSISFTDIGSDPKIRINEKIFQNSFVIKKIKEFRQDIELTFDAIKKI